MKASRYFFALLLVLSACSDDENPVNPPEIASVISPLDIGNKWVYQRSNYEADGSVLIRDTITVFILGDTLIDNEQWFAWGVSEPAGEFFTNKTDGLWYRQKNVSTPGLAAKYPAEDGDTFTERHGDTVLVVSTNRIVTVPGGTFSCYEYMQPPSLSGGLTVRFRYLHEYCPGVGLIRMEQFITPGSDPEYLRYSLELLSYSIAG